MKKILNCRRSLIAIYAITCLTFLCLIKNLDVALAISGVAGALAGFNAYEKKDRPDA